MTVTKQIPLDSVLQEMPKWKHFLHKSLRIPHKRVKKIIQTDVNIGTIKKPVSIMIAKLTELFLQRVIEKGGERALKEVTLLGIRCPMLRMRHLTSVIRNDVKMDFLIPLIKTGKTSQKRGKP